MIIFSELTDKEMSQIKDQARKQTGLVDSIVTLLCKANGHHTRWLSVDDRIVGGVHFMPEQGTLKICWLGILEPGKGYGRILLTTLEFYGKVRGYQRVLVFPATATEEFYARCGYTQAGRHMERKLTW